MTIDPPSSREPTGVRATRRRRRRVAAPLTRIAVAGLSASTTFGLVAAMGAVAETNNGESLAPVTDPVTDPAASVAGAALAATTPVDAPTTTRRQIVVVEHLPMEPDPTVASAPASSAPAAAAAAAPVPATAAAPAPVVTAAPAPAPVVTAARAPAPVTETKRS